MRPTCRRGSPSANSRWDNSVAILTGDFLFACASKILADLGPEAVRIQAETFTRLVTGQICETVGPRPGQDQLEHYMGVITEKTASLVATSGQFGAMFSGAPDEVAARIAPACAALGVAFQLSDDILDVASETDQSGKTPGTDLREGVKTLPVLHALRSAGPGDERLIELLSGGELIDPAARAETLALLRAHPGMDMARADLRLLGRLGQAGDPCPAPGTRQGRVRDDVRLCYGEIGLAGKGRSRPPGAFGACRARECGRRRSAVSSTSA